MSCGRLERYKGHHRVIEALPLVQQKVPDATLHILGSGSYEKELRSLINALGLENSVTIEHIVPGDRQRMAESLSQAAVVTVLSDNDSMQNCREAGANAYHVKPIRRAELLETVKQQLAARRKGTPKE